MDKKKEMLQTIQTLEEEINERETPILFCLGGKQNKILLNKCKAELYLLKQEIIKC